MIALPFDSGIIPGIRVSSDYQRVAMKISLPSCAPAASLTSTTVKADSSSAAVQRKESAFSVTSGTSSQWWTAPSGVDSTRQHFCCQTQIWERTRDWSTKPNSSRVAIAERDVTRWSECAMAGFRGNRRFIV